MEAEFGFRAAASMAARLSAAAVFLVDIGL